MNNHSELSPAAKAAASELNNLLHVIAGTADIIGNVWHGSAMADKYVAMLRDSVNRAADITSTLVAAASGDNKIVFHPAALEAVRQSRTAPRRPAVTATRPEILVVDDEPMAVHLAEQVLSDAGFNVTGANSGFECLKIFSAAPDRFALIILDLRMPVMDGQETFERLRAIKPDVRVLLNTGFIDRAKAEAMFARGLSALLAKPSPPGEYVAKVESVLATPPTTAADGTPAA